LICQRQYDRFPFVPSNPAVRDHRCYEPYQTSRMLVLVRRSPALDPLDVVGIVTPVVTTAGLLGQGEPIVLTGTATSTLGVPA